jgi:hypothetical protein
MTWGREERVDAWKGEACLVLNTEEIAPRPTSASSQGQLGYFPSTSAVALILRIQKIRKK